MDEEYSFHDIFTEFRIMKATAIKRFAKLGIKKARRERFHSIYHYDDVIKMVESVPSVIKRSPEHRFAQRLRRCDLQVIHLFTTLKDNRTKVIAELTGYSTGTIDRYLKNYFEDGFVLAESKLNNMDLDFVELK